MIHIVNTLRKSDYTDKFDLVASPTTITVTDDSDYKLLRKHLLEDTSIDYATKNPNIILLIVTRLLNNKVYTYNVFYHIEDGCISNVIKSVDYSKFDNLLEFLSNRYNFFATLSDDDFKYFSKGI